MSRFFHSCASLYSQRGNVAPFMVLALGGALLATAYALDTSRMVDSSSQLKRATDEAVLAVGRERLMDDTKTLAELTTLAQGYISHNLGLDASLAQRLNLDNVVLTTAEGENNRDRYTVTAQFDADSPLLEAGTKTITIHSTAEVISSPTEISLVLPNTITESSSDIAALRRLGRHFAEQLLTGANQTRLALVPYSQSVNVYADDDTGRLRRWSTPAALTPPELRSLFRTGKASSLADPRMPDRAAHLLCMYRGLGAGDNFDWDRAPNDQFGIYYRHDLPENGSPGADPIDWVGPNPDLGGTGASDTRWIVADKGCPNTPLLPLTDELDEVDKRLDQMETRFNVNYAIAMSWAGASLSPQMRGSNGWGDNDYPLDFNPNGKRDNQKIIVMLANTSGDWFDTDAYNFKRTEFEDTEGGNEPAKDFARQRFMDLCTSFHARGLKFYFIGVRPGDPADFGRTLFDQVAGPGLRVCASDGGQMNFADAPDFATGEDQIENLLQDILSDIQLNSSVRLVE